MDKPGKILDIREVKNIGFKECGRCGSILLDKLLGANNYAQAQTDSMKRQNIYLTALRM
ncbi:MAG: hypothetical protein ACHBN1_10180 [Heteroscytonema crispum UTEX LB 1556]